MVTERSAHTALFKNWFTAVVFIKVKTSFYITDYNLLCNWFIGMEA